MGACIGEKRRSGSERNIQSPTLSPHPITNSSVQFSSLKLSSIFSDFSCPVENQLIIEGFKKLANKFPMNNLDTSLRSYQWKKIACPHNESDKIWGVCYWKSDADNTLEGEGLLYYNQEKNVEFLIGGVFTHGSIIEKGKYFRVFQKGSYYIGEINKEFQPHGYGQIFVTQSESYEGYFNKGVPHGNGKKKIKGKQFTGKFKNGELVSGIQATERGSYEGEFKDSRRHGKGILKMNNGLTYQGQFSNNKRNGMGTLKNNENKVLYHGLWRDDKQYEDEIK